MSGDSLWEDCFVSGIDRSVDKSIGELVQNGLQLFGQKAGKAFLEQLENRLMITFVLFRDYLVLPFQALQFLKRELHRKRIRPRLLVVIAPIFDNELFKIIALIRRQ